MTIVTRPDVVRENPRAGFHVASKKSDKKTPTKGGTPKTGRRSSKSNENVEVLARPEEDVSLHDIAQIRYLNYALSVITSRALPDVRDGLKPVQRRILFTMWQQRLFSDAKHRKCASVVGDTMSRYHPHGDSSIYDALVRLAQPFSLRVPLVEGAGNFGSLDGDSAAAMRYTECRLAALSSELLTGLDQGTVHYHPNYDGTKSEPTVLPAKLPNLLVNGTTGIAVGMATNIPPHNPEEVCAASVRLLDALLEGKQLSSRELARTIKGPDFPTGGQIARPPRRSRTSTRRAKAPSSSAPPGSTARSRARARSCTLQAFRTRRTSRCSWSASPTSCSAGRCRSSSTSRTSRPRTCASSSS